MSKINEENKFSLEAGELVHGIANRLISGEIKIQNMCDKRIKALLELSEVLRRQSPSDNDAPILLAEGFNITHFSRPGWISLATHLIEQSAGSELRHCIDSVVSEGYGKHDV